VHEYGYLNVITLAAIYPEERQQETERILLGRQNRVGKRKQQNGFQRRRRLIIKKKREEEKSSGIINCRPS